MNSKLFPPKPSLTLNFSYSGDHVQPKYSLRGRSGGGPPASILNSDIKSKGKLIRVGGRNSTITLVRKQRVQKKKLVPGAKVYFKIS